MLPLLKGSLVNDRVILLMSYKWKVSREIYSTVAALRGEWRKIKYKCHLEITTIIHQRVQSIPGYCTLPGSLNASQTSYSTTMGATSLKFIALSCTPQYL